MTADSRSCRSGLHQIPAGDRFCRPCKEARRRARDQSRRGLDSSTLLQCPACPMTFEVLRSEHARLHGFANVQAFKQHFGLDSCASQAQRERVSRQFKGQPNTKKTNGQRGLKRSPESRARMSAAAVERCIRNPGPLFSRIRGGWVFSEKADQDVYLRSSYERRLLWVLDRHPGVLEVKVEPFAIPYDFEGVTLHYIPDFLVTLEDGIQELWEVKPQKFVADPQNQAKFAALYEYARAQGMNSAVVTLEDIKRMERRVLLHQTVGVAMHGSNPASQA